MKILLISQHFLPQLGGIQNNLRSLVTCFQPEDIFIIAPTENSETNDSRLKKYAITRKPFVKLLGFLPSLPRLFSSIRSFQPDVIVCGHVKQGIEGYVLGKLMRRPFVVLLYAREIHRLSQNRLYKWIIIQIILRAKKVIVISEYTKTLTKEFIGDRVKRVSFGMLHPIHEQPMNVSVQDIQEIKNKYQLSSGKYLFSVSRLEQRKGIDTVIRCMPIVWKLVPEAVLIIASTGPDEARLKVLSERITQENIDTFSSTEPIVFTGKISDEEKAAFYTLCDVYVTPSRVISGDDAEGFGIVFLEANSYGKPVIAGNSGGIPDAVVDGVTGILVDPQSIEDTANAILKVLQDPELSKRLGENGEVRAEEEFSPDKFCNMLHEILNEACY